MGNLMGKFAYDGLDHHTLLAARHYERVRRGSVVIKRGFVEGGGGGNGYSNGSTCR